MPRDLVLPALADVTDLVPDKHADPAVTVSLQSLLDERHTLRDSTMQQPAGSGRWTGNFRGARRGHGTDFDDLRHYSPGDELRHIDWNASARTDTLHTRLYREEREHRVTFITDLRRSMFTGTRALRSAKACHLTARLLWQAIECGSRACIVIICDNGLAVSDSGGGHRAAIDACALLVRRFQAVQPENGKPDPPLPESHPDELISTTSLAADADSMMTLEQVAHWLSAHRQLHGSLIWVSAFDQPGQHFNEAMNVLSQETRQIAIHVDDDMLEQGLPPGHYGYRSGNWHERTQRTINLSRKNAGQLKHYLLLQKQQRIDRFSELLIPLLNSDDGHAQIVASLRQSGHLP